jgi:hypothetical protein
VHTEFQWGNLRERDRLEGPRLEGRLILKWKRKKDQPDAHIT